MDFAIGSVDLYSELSNCHPITYRLASISEINGLLPSEKEHQNVDQISDKIDVSSSRSL